MWLGNMLCFSLTLSKDSHVFISHVLTWMRLFLLNRFKSSRILHEEPLPRNDSLAAEALLPWAPPVPLPWSALCRMSISQGKRCLKLWLV